MEKTVMEELLNGFLNNLHSIKDVYHWRIIAKVCYGTSLQYLIRGFDKDGNPHCPLCAVAHQTVGKLFGLADHEKAGESCLLPPWIARDIMRASDTLLDWRVEIRKALLTALELEEARECDQSTPTSCSWENRFST
jgi:hypothetical protein